MTPDEFVEAIAQIRDVGGRASGPRRPTPPARRSRTAALNLKPDSHEVLIFTNEISVSTIERDPT